MSKNRAIEFIEMLKQQRKKEWADCTVFMVDKATGAQTEIKTDPLIAEYDNVLKVLKD